MSATTPTEPATPQDILTLAADLLEEFEWCQGRLGSRDEGEFCVVGALGEAQVLLGGKRSGSLIAALNRAGIPASESGLELAQWNDHSDREKAEVVAKLRLAAELS